MNGPTKLQSTTTTGITDCVCMWCQSGGCSPMSFPTTSTSRTTARPPPPAWHSDDGFFPSLVRPHSTRMSEHFSSCSGRWEVVVSCTVHLQHHIMRVQCVQWWNPPCMCVLEDRGIFAVAVCNISVTYLGIRVLCSLGWLLACTAMTCQQFCGNNLLRQHYHTAVLLWLDLGSGILYFVKCMCVRCVCVHVCVLKLLHIVPVLSGRLEWTLFSSSTISSCFNWQSWAW